MKATLSPKEIASALGVGESSVKRWVDDGIIAAARTSGGHRRIALAEVIRFARESGIPIIRPDVLGLGDLSALIAAGGRVRQAPQEVLQEALLAGQEAEARGIILSQYIAGRSAAELWDLVIAPTMRHVGTLWQHGPQGIYIEHRATDICVQAISQLRLLLPPVQSHAPLAIGGAPSGDPYMLPSLMAATVVAARKFREINLGPETPVEVLAQAAGQFEAKLVWLAVSVDRPADALLVETERLARSLDKQEAYLVVGGRGVPDGFTPRGHNLHVARSMAELDALARGVLAAKPAGDEPKQAAGAD